MTITRQFLVTIPGWNEGHPADQNASALLDLLREYFTVPSGHADQLGVVPLPNIGADDSDLQTGFRRLAATLRRLDQMNPVAIYSEPVELSRGQISALVAELSKGHPARTGHVDRTALEAVLAIRESDRQPGREVQKNARAQLIITDAICRCVPDEVA